MESKYLNIIKMCYFVEGYVCLWACNAMGVRNTTTRPQAYTGRRARHFLHGIATELVASIWMPVENNDEVVDAFWEEEPFDYCTCKEGKSLVNFINILFMQGIYMIKVPSYNWQIMIFFYRHRRGNGGVFEHPMYPRKVVPPPMFGHL